MVILVEKVVLFTILALLKGSGAATEYEIETNVISDRIYKPDWASLDSRPLPSWYDQSKLGIFIHWGVFSVPSFGSEWFWYNWKVLLKKPYINFMKQNYPPGFTYQDFGRDFTAEFFNASQWAKLFKKAGAKYVVLTSKHHEGFTLFPSKYSFGWNAMDIGPHRDLVGELADAVRAEGLKFGLYYSLFEWFNPLYREDKRNKFKSQEYVARKMMPELYQVIEDYKPEVLWSDGDWEAPDTYWGSKEFLAWLYNESPVKDTVVVNDRWGQGVTCKHGDFYTCTDHYNPGVLQKHKWENCFTIDKESWGYRRNAQLSDIISLKKLVQEVVESVSCRGNVLVNVSPTKDGIITPIFAERLEQMSDWLEINGEAIYDTNPWKVQNDSVTSGVWYTENTANGFVFATFFDWPKKNSLTLGSVKIVDKTVMSLLGSRQELTWNTYKDQTIIQLPPSENLGRPAWVIKMSNV